MQPTTHFTFRPLSMSDADVELSYRWLNMPHIQKAYSRPSSVIAKSEALEYLKQHLEKPMSGFTVLADDVPVGYIGFYAVKECPWPEQDLPEKMVSQVAGMDLFIGEADKLGKGLGQSIILQFLQEKIWPAFDYCMVDPITNNKAAIHCFEKIGFKKHKLVHDRYAADVELALMMLKK